MVGPEALTKLRARFFAALDAIFFVRFSGLTHYERCKPAANPTRRRHIDREKVIMPRQTAIMDPQGNRTGFDEIYDAHFDDIFRYALHRTGNVADAEDLCAQTFLKALKNFWRFRWSGVPISAWLFRIATNEINAHFRKRAKRSFSAIDRHAPQLADDGPDGEDAVAMAEAASVRRGAFAALSAAIQTLKPEDQTLLTLRYFEDKTYGEIAQIVGKREGAVTMRIRRALDKLKRVLNKRGISYEGFREAFAGDAQTDRRPGGVQAEPAP